MTFTVAIESQPTQQVTVEAGDQPKKVTFTFPEGDGTRTVSVSVGDHKLVEKDVRVDCVEPPCPRPSRSPPSACPMAARRVRSSSESSRRHRFVTFTLAIEGQPTQQVTVQPGDQPTTVPFTFPEGEGTRTVTVSIGGEVVATKHVDVDCVDVVPPSAIITAECLPSGGATGVVALTNPAGQPPR